MPLEQHPTDPDKLVFRSHLRKGSEMSSPIDLALQALEILRTEPMAKTAADKAQALLEQIEQAEQAQPVDSVEKASAYMEARLWEFIDMAAAWPKANPDPRTWSHLMVYAPQRPRLDQGPDYERGFIDGMQQQMQSSVDKKVNAMSRQWVGLTDEEVTSSQPYTITRDKGCFHAGAKWADAKLKEKNT